MKDKTPNPGAAPRENKMGVMPEGRLLAGMAVPMMISMLVQALYNVVDSVFVAQISQDALNAVSLAFPLQNLMIAIGGGTALGMNALLSRSLGEKRQDMADRAANVGIFLSLASYAVFALTGLLLARPFFLAQTDITAIVDYGTDYARICMGLSVGIFCQFCFERMLQATGRTTLSMCTQLIGALINIVLDPILIFGLLGFPRMEVAGAAAATVTGQIVAAVVAVVMNIKCNPDVHIRPRFIRFDRRVSAEIYRVGLPTIVMQSIGSVMTFGMNKILIAFSETAVAVFGVYFKLQSFIFMPIFGLNNGMIPIVAYNYGARSKKRIMATVRMSIYIAVGIMLIGLVVFQLFTRDLLMMFQADENMLAIGVPALRIISLSFLFAGYCIIVGSVFQALGNGVYSLIVSIARQLVCILPLAYFFAREFGLHAVWYSIPIAEITSVILSTILFRKIYLEKIKVLD